MEIKRFKNILLLMISFCTFQLQAQNHEKLRIKGSTGFNVQNLDWSIAGNLEGKDPNIYSELIWSKLKGVKSTIGVGYNFFDNLIYEVEFSKTAIFKGAVSDHDYESDDRKNSSYSAFLNSDKGNSIHLNNNISYRINLTPKIKITPKIGYALNKQTLFLLDNDNRTPIENKLNSNYKTTWKGLNLGLESSIPIAHKLDFILLLFYQQLNYSAKANWNLIDAFAHPISFRHTAKGNAFGGSAGFLYSLNKRFSFDLSFNYYNSETGYGIDQLFLESGEERFTRLNHVDYNSKSINIGLIFKL